MSRNMMIIGAIVVLVILWLYFRVVLYTQNLHVGVLFVRVIG